MKDKRLDAYVENAPGFARPILAELRTRIHAAVPGLEETMKWSSPHFMYGGKLFFGMSAFKQHVAFGFWHAMMRAQDTSLEGMGRFKPASLADLPTKGEFAKLAKEAKRLADEGRRARNTWNGSPRRSASRRALHGSRRPSSGWPKASSATGNTCRKPDSGYAPEIQTSRSSGTKTW